MPVTDSSLTYAQMQKLTGTHECICGARLSVAWDGDKNSYLLRCGRDKTHEGIREIDISGEMAEIRQRLGRRNKEVAQTIGKEKATAMIKYDGVTSLTQRQARDIVQTIWPDAPEIEVKKASILCCQYGLNPLMKHVFLIPYKNKQTNEKTWALVLGIRATRLIAGQQGRYGYLDGTPRVMTDDEQTKTFGKVDADKIWCITKIRDVAGFEAQGYGFWPKADTPKGADKGNTRENMASIRSERQAFDRLFPGRMPDGIDTEDEQFIEPGIAKAQIPVVNAEPEVEPDSVEEPGCPEPSPNYPRNPETVKTINELLVACLKDFNLQKADVCKELNIENITDLTSKPNEAYMVIAYPRCK